MTGSSFVAPPYPKVTTEDAVEAWRVLNDLVRAANGDTSAQRLWSLTGVTDTSSYVLTVQNQGAGGHINVPGIFAATSTGVSMGGTLGVTGTITSNSTIQGTRFISTVATGTAPLTVASTTLVTNLNADLLDGINASDFLTEAEASATYLALAGGTITGNLTVQGAFQVDGNTTLGNAIGDTVTIAGPATVGGTLGVTGVSTLAGTTVTSFTATGAAAFDSSVTLGNASGDAITVTGTATFAQTPVFNAQIDVQGGTAGSVRAGAVIVNAASLSGTEELRVNGQSRLEGAVEITTGGLSVEGGAIINLVQFDGTGTVFTLIGSSQTQSTVGGAGGASALPATPRGYLKIEVGATSRVIPYYDAS